MPKFLIQASYTSEGAKGLMREGGTGRAAAVDKAVKSLGGRVEATYFAFGKTDVFIIVDFPDPVSALALSIAVNQTGMTQASLTVLLTPQEVDAATKKAVEYRAPGR